MYSEEKQIDKRFCEGLYLLLKYIRTERMYEEVFLEGKKFTGNVNNLLFHQISIIL